VWVSAGVQIEHYRFEHAVTDNACRVDDPRECCCSHDVLVFRIVAPWEGAPARGGPINELAGFGAPTTGPATHLEDRN
jgi:hypothetical protein